MEITPTTISISAIKEKLQTFVSNKPDFAKWKDFYESSTGVLLIELLSILGSYVGVQGLITRRETYLPNVKLRTSAVGLAENLDYSAYRGKNEHIAITISPISTMSLEKYSIVGLCSGKSMILTEAVSIAQGVEVTLEVILGDLKEETIIVDSSDTNLFRFQSPDVSEDISLFLNDIEVPISKNILDLLNDYYVAISNSFGSIDVYYLDRPQPYNWMANSDYNTNEYITPNFKRRNNTHYYVGDRVVPIADSRLCYEAIAEGVSGNVSPVWKSTVNSLTSDNNVVWQCLGEAVTGLYFRSITPGKNYSGNTEPIWPMIQGKTIIDNEITWVCTRDFTFSKYYYSTNDILTLKYIESASITYTESDLDIFYGALISYQVSNKYAPPETIDSIKINAPLYHETRAVVKGRQDFRKMLKEAMPSVIATNGHDLSPAVVELTYVKDHTTTLWETKRFIPASSMILPSTPNGFIYRTMIEGYTNSGTSGLSGASEPIWPTVIGETVVDNVITWVCFSSATSGDAWQADTLYNINAKILVSGFLFVIQEIDTEPIWPTVIGETVEDNNITWTCIDDIYVLGYEAKTWEVNIEITAGDYVFPIEKINYFYKALSGGVTSNYEPIWPTVIGETVIEGDITWECYDLIEAEKYQKNIALEKLSSYRVFGIQPATIKDPVFVFVKLKIDVYILKGESVLSSKVKDDVDGILENYERELECSLDLKTIENKCEQLAYVKIVRATVVKETKSTMWEENTTYEKKDVVYPTTPNGFCYECYYIRSSRDSGETQGTAKGYTGGEEPIWPTVIGETIIDNHILWECNAKDGVPTIWQRNVSYNVDDTIVPSTDNGFMYKFLSITEVEPVWPTELNKSIVDYDIYWIARNPMEFSPSCGWDEYYIIGREIEVIK